MSKDQKHKKEFKKEHLGYYIKGRLIPEIRNYPTSKELAFLKNLGLDEYMLWLELTKAEIQLFDEGLYSGIIGRNLPSYTPLQDRVIRSELVEWLFDVPRQHKYYFFRTTSLSFRNVVFMRFEDFQNVLNYQKSEDSDGPIRKEIPEKVSKRFYNTALNLSNLIIELNLSFNRCLFCGDLEIESTRLENLSFIDCKTNSSKRISSFLGEKIEVKGQLSIVNQELNDNITLKSDFFQNFDLSYSKIDSRLYINGLLLNDGELNLYQANINYTSIENSWFYDAEVNFALSQCTSVFLSGVRAFVLNNTDRFAIDFNSITAKTLSIRKSYILGPVSFKYAEIQSIIQIRECAFCAELIYQNPFKPGQIPYYSMNLSNVSSPAVQFYDGFVSIGTLELSNITVDKVWINEALLDGSIINSRNETLEALKMCSSNISQSLAFNPNYLDLAVNEKDISKNNTLKNLKAFIENLIALYNKDKVITTGEEESDSLNSSKLQRHPANQLSEFVLKRLQFLSNSISNIMDSLSEDRYDRNTVVRGGANMSGMTVSGQLDCAGALFDHPISAAKTKEGNLALNLKYLNLDGDLFLDDYKSRNVILKKDNNLENEEKEQFIKPFEVYGAVDLENAHVRRLFLTPHNNKDKEIQWHVNGLDYEMIIDSTRGSKSKKDLEKLNWFTPNKIANNARQPYEELAQFYQRSGNDTIAKRILIEGRMRTPRGLRGKLSAIFYWLMQQFGMLFMPAPRAFAFLVASILVGTLVFYYANKNGGFDRVTIQNQQAIEVDNSRLEFSPLQYSVSNMFPIVLFSREFKPNSESIEIGSIGNYEISLVTDKFVFWHKFISFIAFTMFVIGISRITKMGR